MTVSFSKHQFNAYTKVNVDELGVQYAEVLRGCYTLSICLPNSLRFISKIVINAIFQSIKNDTACFLTAIWTDTALPASLQVAALKHCQAFVVSKTDGTDFKQDFQIILPALLIALTLPSQATREAAMDCIAVLAMSDASAKDVPIYAFDALYGSFSGRSPSLNRILL